MLQGEFETYDSFLLATKRQYTCNILFEKSRLYIKSAKIYDFQQLVVF